MLKVALVLLIFFHGLLHLSGFYRLSDQIGVIRLAGYIPKSLKSLGLICTILFFLTGFLLIFEIQAEVHFLAAVLILSQTLIFLRWEEARWGSLVNFLLLVLGIRYFNILGY